MKVICLNNMKIIIIFALVVNCQAIFDINLMKSYFAKKFINIGAVFCCYDKIKDEIALRKQLVLLNQSTFLFNLKRRKFTGNLNTNSSNFGVIVDGDCENVYELLEESGRKKYFNVRHHWLITSVNESFPAIFESIILNIDCDVHVAIMKQEGNWSIYDIYNPASQHGGSLNINHIGFYDDTVGYNISTPSSKYTSRRNMTGIHFKSIIVLPAPFEGPLEDYLKSDENRTVNTFNRFHSCLVFHCRDFYNFSLKVNMTTSWGYLQPDGNFDGMVGELQKGNVDFGNSPIYVKEERIPYVQYGRFTWDIRAAFIFRNPKSLSSIQIFMQPLTTSVWISTLCLAILIIFALRITLRFESKILNNLKHYMELSWSFIILVTLGAFCQQGSTNIPYLLGGRILTIFVLLLSLIIYQFYSASIVSFLLMKPITTIKSAADITKSSLKVGCEDVLYLRAFFQETTNPVAIELYRKKMVDKFNHTHYHDAHYGISHVRKEKFAFYTETNTAYPIIENTFDNKEICELRELEMARFQHAHAPARKFSPFHDMLDTCLQRLAETGIHNRQLKHWESRKPACIHNGNTLTFNVGIEEMYPALMIFIIGLGIALVIFLIEIGLQLRKNALERNIEAIPVYPFVN